jgi:hypothetical protein
MVEFIPKAEEAKIAEPNNPNEKSFFLLNILILNERFYNLLSYHLKISCQKKMEKCISSQQGPSVEEIYYFLWSFYLFFYVSRYTHFNRDYGCENNTGPPRKGFEGLALKGSPNLYKP